MLTDAFADPAKKAKTSAAGTGTPDPPLGSSPPSTPSAPSTPTKTSRDVQYKRIRKELASQLTNYTGVALEAGAKYYDLKGKARGGKAPLAHSIVGAAWNEIKQDLQQVSDDALAVMGATLGQQMPSEVMNTIDAIEATRSKKG